MIHVARHRVISTMEKKIVYRISTFNTYGESSRLDCDRTNVTRVYPSGRCEAPPRFGLP